MRSKEVRLEFGVEFEKAVLAQGGSRADIAFVLEERKDIVGRCAELVLATAREMKNRLEFSVSVSDDETFEGLVQDGKYDWWDGITAKRFPIRKFKPGERKLVILHFNRLISSEEVIREAEKQGFVRPTYEDCLRFGAQYPDVQRQFPVVFLHEPVLDSNGNSSVLCLGRFGSNRSLNCIGFVSAWSGICHFVFVCPPTTKA